MIALLLGLAIQGSAISTCVELKGPLEGEFRYVESRHPNGTNLRYGFVVTPEPVCITDMYADGFQAQISGRWVQVSWSDEQIGDHPQPGDLVRVAVNDCFEPSTAWHLGDIICINAKLVHREPM
jgi:hypothetical protein